MEGGEVGKWREGSGGRGGRGVEGGEVGEWREGRGGEGRGGE